MFLQRGLETIALVQTDWLGRKLEIDKGFELD